MSAVLCGRWWFRTFNVIDEANREALGLEVATSSPSARVVRIMEQLIEICGKSKTLRLDDDSELTSLALTERCERQEIEPHFIQPGKPYQNAFIERFNKTYRKEVLDAYFFDSLEQVRQITESRLGEYNQERPHDSLGCVPPLTLCRGQQLRSPHCHRLLDGGSSLREHLAFSPHRTYDVEQMNR